MIIENRNGTDYIGVVLSSHRIGWATWNRNQRLATDPTIVKLVRERASSTRIVERAIEIYPEGNFNAARMNDQLYVSWVPTGQPFRVIHDPKINAEAIEFFKKEEWICG